MQRVTTFVFSLLLNIFILISMFNSTQMNAVCHFIDKNQKVSTSHLNAKKNSNLNNVFLSWDSCSSHTAIYEIYKSVDSGKSWQIHEFKFGNEPAHLNGKYTCVDSNPLGVEWYKLKILDSSKNQVVEDFACVDYSHKCSSVLKRFQSKPKNGNFSFEVNSTSEYSVLNEAGKICKVGKTSGLVLVSDLQAGVYYLNIISQYQVETYRVLVL